MTVTDIAPLDKRRSKVTLDEDFTLVLYKGEVKRFEIEKDKELTEEAYQTILHEILEKRAVERALYLLQSSDKTEAELRRKLKEGYYPQEAIDHTIDFLKRYRYIDDENYVKRYVETYSAKKSRRQLLFDLQRKGIQRDMAEAACEEQPIDEETQILDYIRKKKLVWKELNPKEKNRVYASLGRKGYSYEAIKRALEGKSDYFSSETE